MRYAAAVAVTLAVGSTTAHAEPLAIDQSAWLNYAIVVNTTSEGSNLRLKQQGSINGISSVQMSGDNDAQLWTHQRGRRNSAAIYQSGWNTIARVVQEGPGQSSGHTDLPTRYIGRDTDEGYLSYFMTGGFSLVALTDRNHTWISRFGRAR